MGWELPGATPPCVPPMTAGSDVGMASGGSSSTGSCLTGRGWNPGGGWTCNQNTMVNNVCMYIVFQFQGKMRSTTEKYLPPRGHLVLAPHPIEELQIAGPPPRSPGGAAPHTGPSVPPPSPCRPVIQKSNIQVGVLWPQWEPGYQRKIALTVISRGLWPLTVSASSRRDGPRTVTQGGKALWSVRWGLAHSHLPLPLCGGRRHWGGHPM